MAAPKYRSLGLADGKDVSLDAAAAYGQASQALDAAAAIAVASADAESLATIAALWIRVGENLITDADLEHDEEAHDLVSKTSSSEDVSFGFNNKHLENEDDEQEESGDGDDD